MRVKGRVVGNTVVLEEPMPDGLEVEVRPASESGEDDFELTDEMYAELEEASRAAQRGEVVEMKEALARVKW